MSSCSVEAPVSVGTRVTWRERDVAVQRVIDGDQCLAISAHLSHSPLHRGISLVTYLIATLENMF